ncbi:MAG: DNA-deoxyinosine glycosylase [Burkholderiales bacterium]|nr:MAG: DNA-deoxyinosine glycosylase [Burkholderiales bacterium]
MTRLLQGLPPVIAEQTRLLVLGSFPGVASLRAQQYYAHPQNQFWKILSALWATDLTGMPYDRRIEAVRSLGLGIWDVYAACEREGSLDADIRAGKLNDFDRLRSQCPRLQAIAHNGGESFRHARHTRALGLPVYRLPSTSPANASWSFERKLAAWREVLGRHGLLR